ncbi:replication protein A 70 kDa DNA-binding subunit C-like protein [Tanacetum coccineum]
MIHCNAKATIAHNFLRLKEGGIFLIKNFAVRPNKDVFWVFRHDMFMLEFDGSTTIRKVSANSDGFVRYTFQLVDFDDIELINNKYMIGNHLMGEFTKGHSMGGVGDSLIEKKTAHVGMCAIMLTSMTVKTYINKLYLSSTSSTIIYDNDDIPSLQELKSVTSLVEPKKEMMMSDSSQPREWIVENLLMWVKNRKNDAVTFQCKVMIEDIRRKSGWNYPSCGGEKCRKSVSRKARKFLCETCNRTVDYPVLRYRLEVVVADKIAQTVVVMFNEIATELLNCSTDSLIEEEDEKINPADLVDDEASSSNQLITVDDSKPSFKRLARQPSMCTPSKPNEEKRKKRLLATFNTMKCCVQYEINDDGPVNKKKRKMRIDEDSDSVCIVPGLWSKKMSKFHLLTFTIEDEEDARRAYSSK